MALKPARGTKAGETSAPLAVPSYGAMALKLGIPENSFVVLQLLAVPSYGAMALKLA